MCSGEKLDAESSNRAALKECVSKQRGCVFGRTLRSGVLRLQTSSSQGVTQEKDKGLPPPRNNSKAMPRYHGQSPHAPGGDAYRSGTIPVPAAPAPVWFGTGSSGVDSSV